LEPLARAHALQAFEAIVGARHLLRDDAEQAPFLTDQRRLFTGRAIAIALPQSTDEVSRLLSYCFERRIPVVPQGGNTGYCGGATPSAQGDALLIGLQRLNRIRSTSASNDSLVAEAGCTLASVQAAARAAERLFPLSLGSEGSCQIGGNLSTNAGGVHVLRYGTARALMLGLEVVLPDGRVLSSLDGLRKDTRGYALDQCFVGAEGTLGIITAACLRLFPLPRSTAAALVAVRDIAAALALLDGLRGMLGEQLTAFEAMPRLAIELAVEHLDAARDPFDRAYPWVVLCEASSTEDGTKLDAALENALAAASADGIVLDAALARSEAQRIAFWFLREHIPEAQRLSGGSIKHDIALPRDRLVAFYETAAAWVAGNVPEARLCAYGHLGDGNLHFNLNQAPGTGRDAFLAREPIVQRAIHDLVAAHGGTFSAEHGIGQLKVRELERYRTPQQIQTMRALKQALDPRGIMNPGKVLPP